MTTLQLIATSHRRQFSGEDYQAVAIEIAAENKINFEDEKYTLLQTAPDPNCNCNFCRHAKWEET